MWAQHGDIFINMIINLPHVTNVYMTFIFYAYIHSLSSSTYMPELSKLIIAVCDQCTYMINFSLLTYHWCLKSMKGGIARAKVPCLKNLDVLLSRIDAQR